MIHGKVLRTKADMEVGTRQGEWQALNHGCGSKYKVAKKNGRSFHYSRYFF